ncbi:hypothetical protein H072_2633 [Dactylellina haptotyla CBS 200.50]|uniref:Nucleoporin Nup54 alpha-helical domain-containing protein n=1 Tax=Dactylellina haptotyla (strain CBS 200.50) TaxID=1284197 RepID=S8AK90_DACHA|nr:hypothetical protein H072_2633 [Dactylellina haptotyla CBS 200.50]
MSLFNRVSNTPSAINTSAANTFGTASGAATGGIGGTAAAPSLFGQSTASQAPASAGLFGGAPAAAPSGGLFGATANTTATNAPTAGGLFGGAAQTAAPAAGGLFGAAPSITSAGAGTFGAAAATPSAPAAGGLFGAGQATAQAPAPSGFFGGGPAMQPGATQTGAAGGGLFGGSTAGGSGLFASQAQRPAGSMFGQPPAQPQPNMFGQSQAQAQPQAVEMNFSNMRGTTRYEELHADVRNLLDFLDDYIQKAIGISQELSARTVGHKETMESVDGDVEHVSRKLGFTTTFLNNDGHSIGQLHNASSQLINTAALSTRTIDILRLPISQRSQYLSSHHTSNPEYSLIPYFEEKAGELEGKTQNFLAAVDEVEKTLEAVERDVGQVNMSAESKVKEVVKAERVVFSGMLAVASKVASVNEDLKVLTR